MNEFINEKEIEKIVLEHIVNNREAEEKSKELLKSVFSQVISRVLLQVKIYLETANHFKSAEKMYQQSKSLQKKLHTYLKELEIPEDENKSMIQGIMQTLEQSLEEFPVGQENPIEYERILFISTRLLKLKETMNQLEEDTLHEFELPISIYTNVIDVLNQHIGNAYAKLKEQLNIAMEEALSGLNDYEQRKELIKYHQFTHEQEELLKPFTEINFEIGFSGQELKLGQEMNIRYVYPIKQFYQELHIQRVEIDNMKLRSSDKNHIQLLNIENLIETKLLTDPKVQELIELVEYDKNNTIDMIVNHINDELSKVSAYELKRVKKDSGRFELLSCFIVELFEDALLQMDQINLEGLTEEEEKMIRAILDTLHLKHNVLKEKDEEYHLRKKEEYLNYGESFLRFRNEFEKECEKFLEEAIQGTNQGFIKTQEKFTRIIELEREKHLERDLNYVKKEILSEFITFEELMFGAVLTLKNSQKKACLELALQLENLYQRMLFSLKKADITQMAIQVGDNFDGKLQEVLMVEEDPTKKKGCILRVTNQGYHYQDTVLLRASVIVAK